MKTYPTPHSSAWFEMLLRINTGYAVHVGRVILSVRNTNERYHHWPDNVAEDCCSACGGMPDIDDVGHPIIIRDIIKTEPAGTYSDRLCDDCISIQKSFGYTHRAPIEGEIEPPP